MCFQCYCTVCYNLLWPNADQTLSLPEKIDKELMLIFRLQSSNIIKFTKLVRLVYTKENINLQLWHSGALWLHCEPWAVTEILLAVAAIWKIFGAIHGINLLFCPDSRQKCTFTFHPQTIFMGSRDRKATPSNGSVGSLSPPTLLFEGVAHRSSGPMPQIVRGRLYSNHDPLHILLGPVTVVAERRDGKEKDLWFVACGYNPDLPQKFTIGWQLWLSSKWSRHAMRYVSVKSKNATTFSFLLLAVVCM